MFDDLLFFLLVVSKLIWTESITQIRRRMTTIVGSFGSFGAVIIPSAEPSWKYDPTILLLPDRLLRHPHLQRFLSTAL